MNIYMNANIMKTLFFSFEYELIYENANIIKTQIFH